MSKRPRTDLELELVYGVDTRNRRLFFGNYPTYSDTDDTRFTSINDWSISLAIRSINRMISEFPKVPIELHFHSAGGDPIAMLALYDVILATKTKFIFYGMGQVSSSATWIMCVCDERYLYENTEVLVHNGYYDYDGTYDDNQLKAEYEKRLAEKLYAIYTENSKMPIEFWRNICQRDSFLTAEETVKLGLADFIVPRAKRGNLRKARINQMSQSIDNKEMNELVKTLYKRINLPIGDINLVIPTIKPDECDPDVIEMKKEDYIEEKE